MDSFNKTYLKIINEDYSKYKYDVNPHATKEEIEKYKTIDNTFIKQLNDDINAYDIPENIRNDIFKMIISVNNNDLEKIADEYETAIAGARIALSHSTC